MKRILPTLIAACLLIGCSAAPTPAPAQPTPYPSRETLTGLWLGSATEPGGKNESLLLRLTDAGATLQIEPYIAIWDVELTTQESAVSFSLRILRRRIYESIEEVDFTGIFANGSLTGQINWDGTSSDVTFVPILSVDASQLEKYEGVYRFDYGHSVSIIVSPPYEANGLRFFAEGLTFTDFSTGDSRALYAFDESTFAVGALRTIGQPFEGRVQFVRDEAGNVTGLKQWSGLDSSAPLEQARRVNFAQKDVTYTSADGTVLAGLVSIPESDSRVPAIVALHGSEPGTRRNFGNKIMAHFMVSRGIAILNFDKRGAGDSGGTYRESADTSNLTLLAQDVVAGVQLMAARPAVDATRIGLIGGSQAGWVIPLAAAESDLVAYFVILSGPVISTFHEDVYSGYTDDGESATTYDVEALNQRLREMHGGGFDPLPILAELTQPGLWLWGDVDKSVPVTVSAENLQVLIDGGKTNFSYVIFAGGDHNLNFSTQGLFDEIPFAPRILYCQALTGWLETNVLKAK